MAQGLFGADIVTCREISCATILMYSTFERAGWLLCAENMVTILNLLSANNLATILTHRSEGLGRSNPGGWVKLWPAQIELTLFCILG